MQFWLPCAKGAVAQRLRDCFLSQSFYKSLPPNITTPPSRLRRDTDRSQVRRKERSFFKGLYFLPFAYRQMRLYSFYA